MITIINKAVLAIYPTSKGVSMIAGISGVNIPFDMTPKETEAVIFDLKEALVRAGHRDPE